MLTLLEKQLHTSWLGHPVCYQECVESTNNLAKQMAKDGASHGTVIVANQQLAGKGRLGRTWISPKGCAIYTSLILKPYILPCQASCLTLVAALATACAIEQVTGLNCQIKWPNDIVIDGRKVCGILTEMSASADKIHYVVIGIGINVNMTAFDESVEATAISLKQLLGHKVSRTELMAELLMQMEHWHAVFEQNGNLSGMLDAYNQRLVNRDREVRILEPGNEWLAIARRINERGELVVERDGAEQTIVSGEVSVRGVYGYV